MNKQQKATWLKDLAFVKELEELCKKYSRGIKGDLELTRGGPTQEIRDKITAIGNCLNPKPVKTDWNRDFNKLTKVCGCCGIDKHLNSFRNSSTGSLGKYGLCKVCETGGK